ncbi:MAG: protein kinase [Deltaproteobacteria bacterium]|nr:protein kinase [Deltaproteobacteria bacterium]
MATFRPPPGYRLLRPLGQGGMGVVWVAQKLATGETLAIKFLRAEHLEDPSLLARFKREIRALTGIHHPNVVTVFDWTLPGRESDLPACLVMELLDGEGLDVFLRRSRQVPPTTAVHIMLQVLDGLGAAHATGLLHRDIGPSNVILVRRPEGRYQAKLIDFGLARPLVLDEADSNLTQVGTVLGKPAYVAPEIFRGARADQRFDLFGCGMMLYRMLCGRLPYESPGGALLWAERFAERRSDAEYPPPRSFAPDLDPRLEAVIIKATRKHPEDRYSTTEEMQVDLLDLDTGSWLSPLGSLEPPQPRSRDVQPGSDTVVGLTVNGLPASRHVRRKIVLAAAVAATLVALAAVAVFSLSREGASVEHPAAGRIPSPEQPSGRAETQALVMSPSVVPSAPVAEPAREARAPVPAANLGPAAGNERGVPTIAVPVPEPPPTVAERPAPQPDLHRPSRPHPVGGARAADGREASTSSSPALTDRPSAPPDPDPAGPDASAADPSAGGNPSTELLALARRRRATRDWTGAADAFRELLANHPGTSEARTALVGLADLCQGQLGDPAQALGLYVRYLADAGGGALAEQARYGRAQALGRLGRTAEEAAAWRDYLERHADSARAPAARARLTELEGEQAPGDGAKEQR